MDTEDRNTISFSLGCDPVKMDAMYVSPMKRPRLYWSNIPGLGSVRGFIVYWKSNPIEALFGLFSLGYSEWLSIICCPSGDPIQPNPVKDKLDLQQCLEPQRKARVRRVGCITTSWSSQQQGKALNEIQESPY